MLGRRRASAPSCAWPRLPSPHLPRALAAPTCRAGTKTQKLRPTQVVAFRDSSSRLFFGMVVQKYSAACRRVQRPP